MTPSRRSAAPLSACCCQPGRRDFAQEQIKNELFQTSDRCIACHNGLSTLAGEDISIGFAWRADDDGELRARSVLAGRRAPRDHRSSRVAEAAIEDECSKCHMPMARYQAKVERPRGRSSSRTSISPRTIGWIGSRRTACPARCAIRSAGQAGHARELRRRLRHRHDAAARRARGVRSVQDRERARPASCERRRAAIVRPKASTSGSRSCARPATR